MSPRFALRELGPFQAGARAGCKAILVADVSDFYPSLYTHSIPWTFHTKAVAKSNRSNALFGNRLDQLVRNSQDGQTMGVPIGPDTSFIIAEAVLAAVDRACAKKIKPLRGIRWVDGYELTFAERSRAEDALAVIQEALFDFELRVNPRKTSIADLPAEFEQEWVSELRAFNFRKSARGQANDLFRYFDFITRYLSGSENEHIVKYGIARLRTFPIHANNSELFQSLLCQAVAFEPGAIREAVEALYYAQTHHNLAVNHRLLEATLNTIIEQSASVGHDYEVSWCLWAALCWAVSISRKAAAAISQMENSVVAILALHASQQGLIPQGLQTTGWQARMTTADLYEEQWLLAYEANAQGWLPSIGPDHVNADPSFGFLKNLGVRFYIPTQNPLVPGALVYPP